MRPALLRPDHSRGQMLPLLTFGLTAICIFGALAVDVGDWRNSERLQQIAADSAALAGAQEHAYPTSTASPAAWITAAKNDAAANGYTDDGTNTIVSVHNPPTSGQYTSDSTAVEVTVQAKHRSWFAAVIGMNSDYVKTRAVARLSPNAAACIITLFDSDYHTYTATTTGGSLTAPTCGWIDNGNWDFTGGTLDLGYIGVAGSTTYTGGTYALATPQPTVEASDPCKSMTGCANLAALTPGTSPCATSVTSGGVTTWSPG